MNLNEGCFSPGTQGLGAKESMADLPGDRRGNRDLVFDLFELYEELRLKMDAYDLSDVVFNLWSRLETQLPLETLFVDETQDFTQVRPSSSLTVKNKRIQ
jgi:hypothetical protein